MDDVVEYFKVIGSYDEYREQLEFLALKHILLASSLRVVTADCSDELLDKLLDSLTADYPDYAHNKYMSTLSRRERLIYRLLITKRRRLLRALFLSLIHIFSSPMFMPTICSSKPGTNEPEPSLRSYASALPPSKRSPLR